MIFDDIRWLTGGCFYSPQKGENDSGGVEEIPKDNAPPMNYISSTART